MSTRRRRAEKKGHYAETAAFLWLVLKGYKILERRCRTPVGEIDLVATRGNRIIFFEVKLRATRQDAAYSITPRQQTRIARAAQYWLARKPFFQSHDVSFDAVLLAPWSRPHHIRDAFRV